jgi:hypothetical protein
MRRLELLQERVTTARDHDLGLGFGKNALGEGFSYAEG